MSEFFALHEYVRFELARVARYDPAQFDSSGAQNHFVDFPISCEVSLKMFRGFLYIP
jgi:hypothetical protein